MIPEMQAASYTDLVALKVRVLDGVASVLIDHPPINLLDARLIADLELASRLLEADENVRVIVFASRDPEFFIAHADLAMLQGQSNAPAGPPQRLHRFNLACERFRRMDKLSIAQVEGRARGGGSEFALALDLRFAALDRAIFSQPEAALGIIPGGGATQRLPRLLGASRALEVLLCGDDYPAAEAERLGWITRALPASLLGPHVERLASRVARLPPHLVATLKRAVDTAHGDVEEGLLREQAWFVETLGRPAARQRLEAALRAGLQTRANEMEKFQELLKALDHGDV